MRKKNGILLATTFILIFIVILMLYGFFSPYNCYSVRKAISSNSFKKICVNEHPIFYKIEKNVGAKYGFEVINIETRNGFNPINYFGIKSYNKLMIENYIRQKGDSLYKQYLYELDSLFRMNIAM